MENRTIYDDITLRTQGCIYLGIVGPVRTGKSTFIKRFMETLVLPNIDSDSKRERARDELPQSASGRTIMTAEPKFVPEEAVDIQMESGERFSVRLIDCVGYMVDGAVGQLEGELPRMVRTPWFDHEVPMTEAAELGTRKVIAEHSTIGVVVTTDGTITEIPREGYLEAEDRVICELQEIGKPFVVLVNSAYPNGEEALSLCEELTEKYNVSCIPVNCMTLGEREITEIIGTVLDEFPVSQLRLWLPPWVDSLPLEHSIKGGLFKKVLDYARGMAKIRDVKEAAEEVGADGEVGTLFVDDMNLGTGIVDWRIELPREMFYATLSEQSGFEIADDGDLLTIMTQLKTLKDEYERVADALRDVRETGYGIVMPSDDELRLEEPEIVKQGGRYGVKLKATAPSIHMLRTDIETVVSPVMSGEKQTGDMINFLLQEFEGDTNKIWESNIFGKSLFDIAGEGLTAKINRMPEDARVKLREALQRIINEGSGGLICIIL